MFKYFYPLEYVENVYSIDYKKLKNKGYKGIIFDIDNTLVHHGADVTKDVEDLFSLIHDLGVKTLLLSNNSEERVSEFNRNIKTLYVSEAEKPSKINFFKSLDLLNMKKDEVIIIGDQVFTDIYGANICGIDNILVKFMRHNDEDKIGIKRNIEKFLLKFYSKSRRYQHRLGDIFIYSNRSSNKKKRKLFCEMNPFFYMLSTKKEVLKRHIKNMLSRENLHKNIKKEALGNVVSFYSSNMIKRAPGINPEHQYNKAHNIDLSCKKINKIIIRPGEVFSLWRTIGKPSKFRGYKEGRVLINKKLTSGTGGGLCNLANTLHLLILHSPLKVIEFHKHSDALAPDKGKRVPFSSGTSVSYNSLDYRFKNTTDQDFQLLTWCECEEFKAELRSETEVPYIYNIHEEDHHFKQINDKYYRRSKIYKQTNNRKTKELITKELILDNHSEVMYDYDLIPEEQKVN